MDLPSLSYTFLNHAHNFVKNKINKTKQEIIPLQLGRPEDTAAREAHRRGPRRGAAHAGLLPEPRRLTAGTRASGRETGEAASATVELADGEPFGELDSTGMLPKSPRVDCPTNPKL